MGKDTSMIRTSGTNIYETCRTRKYIFCGKIKFYHFSGDFFSQINGKKTLRCYYFLNWIIFGQFYSRN